MDIQLTETHGLRLAIEGCGHGTLHAIYASVTAACQRRNWTTGVDLLLIGGDFQAVRNPADLHAISMPAKYRAMGDFHEYYAGTRAAPYLTIFVGGNHEASNFLLELYYGGWVAPNIYYLGAANVLRCGPVRIAGMGGIWKGFDYRKPHAERLPFTESDVKSIYHVRELDVRKLLQVRRPVDVGVSHDWPQGVEWKGDWKRLFRMKNHFEADARSGRLGSVAAKQVVDRLRPRFWFSAHLHCKFAAVIAHGEDRTTLQEPRSKDDAPESKRNDDEIDLDLSEDVNEPTASKNDDEIDLDLDDDTATDQTTTQQTTNGATNGQSQPTNADEIDLDVDDPTPPSIAGNDLTEARAALPASFRPPPRPEPPQHPPEITNLTTNFLALDKCLPNRHFLQLTLIPTSPPTRPLRLSYDREWLSITRAFTLTEPPVFGDPDAHVPRAKTSAEYAALIDAQREWVDANLSDEDLLIPENFAAIAPVYDGGDWQHPRYHPSAGGLREYADPQTAAFCQMLQMPNPLELSEEERERRMAAGPRFDADAQRFQGGRGRGGGFGRGGGGGRGGRGGRGRGRFRGR